jgi:protein-L-isoaspartate(D-aspartate) O-methyltransferase
VAVDARPFLDRYVDALKRQGAIRSPAVEAAFRTVQRHRLIEEASYVGESRQLTDPIRMDPSDPSEENLALVYSDGVLVTRFAGGRPASSSSQPSLVARMIELLEVRPGMTVLEVGAGTGYNAALLAELLADQRRVVTVDVAEDVVAQARRLLAAAGYPRIDLRCLDGFGGVPERAPFDRIVATVGCPDLSPHWPEQLADGGRMLIPLEHAGSHPLVRLSVRDDGTIVGRVVDWTGFMAIRGAMGALDPPAPFVIAPDGDQGDQVEQRPAWDGMPPGDVVPGWSCTAAELDFLFFLWLADRRAAHSPWGPGLNAGPDGWAAVGDRLLRWWGRAGPALLAALNRAYDEWTGSGRPGFRDYELSFRPLSSGNADTTAVGTVDRLFHRQLVHLPG